MRVATVSCVMVIASSALTSQTIPPPFDAVYTLVDLGAAPGVPSNYGGVAFKIGDPDRLYIGGDANQAEGAVYAQRVRRDVNQHITGFIGTATKYADAPNIDGGLAFGPGGVLFFTRYIVNELGQIKPGSTAMDKSIALSPLGVARSVGAMSFVPAGFPGAGSVKVITWSGGSVHTLKLVPDGSGTFDIRSVTLGPTIPGGPEGCLFTPPDSPLFTNFNNMLVSQYSANRVAVFGLDTAGDPIAATERVLVSGVNGASGAALDPLTGDFVFSTFGGSSRVLAVRGLALPCGAPSHYGTGTAGTGGVVPNLQHEGCLARGQQVSIAIDNGVGGAAGVLLAGLQPSNVQVLGITVLVNPLLSVIHGLSGPAGAAGAGSFQVLVSIPDDSSLLNTNLLLQSVYLDAGAPQAVSASDALRLGIR